MKHKQDSKEKESNIIDYVNLLKPRVMSLVVFTGFVGMYIAPGDIHPLIAFISILCIALGSGASGAINMWYEHDIDKIMNRTKNRPIPSGKIEIDNAIEFAIVMAVISILIMFVAVNFLSAFLLTIAILFYVFIYTIWLKRRTYQNIVIGGAAGAFPPIIGWASVTNQINIEPIILFLIIFIWTPPHFWALALYKSDDYVKANIPMLPVIKGDKNTKLQILSYSIILIFITTYYAFICNKGFIYLFFSIILNIKFMHLAYRLYKSYDNIFAPKLFFYSIIYLFSIFSILILDKLLYYKL